MTKPAAHPRTSREARRITSRLVGFVACASLVLVALAIAATVILGNDQTASETRSRIIELNETRALLADATDAHGAEGANALQEADDSLARAQESLRAAASAQSLKPLALVWIVCAAGILAACAVAAYVYASVVRPFMRLESFADEVASGNLDAPLAYERSNPFGRFTWAFDNMRKEIKRARAAEAEAIDQNKTMIAALSHDIKTPIASIRAYSEALELGLARSEEERASYAGTIMRKCDEVSELTDDLFLHALADLDVIEVGTVNASVDTTVRRAVEDFDATGTIVITRLDEAIVAHDPKRLGQVLENLIANARKYAPDSAIEISGMHTPDAYRIEVRDFGLGIAPEDLPFAFDRFYRGANAGDAPGAGLGLFIAQHLTLRMGATIALEDARPGLRVSVEFPAAS
ncbi:sensor histidine kinase [Raoultibacter phocaeensis]|uniref:sensor histidine kinase n=1 Tax=Raoultibacter phocaeensis TaxID=2479841 RepID=UPI0015D5FC8A|nr:HAMP domain-containing sensor histidine kinase [Raoultibacter phocaeensis]